MDGWGGGDKRMAGRIGIARAGLQILQGFERNLAMVNCRGL